MSRNQVTIEIAIIRGDLSVRNTVPATCATLLTDLDAAAALTVQQFALALTEQTDAGAPAPAIQRKENHE
jgi:hypothetical protein